MSAKPVFLIVGASLAGAKAAEELRTQGFDGRVLLIGAEPERPYERPPLTKDYLRGESEREKAYVHPDGFYAQQEIEFEPGVTVTGIEPGASRVTLNDGRVLGYDKLLLTTGAEPRRLHIPGADLDRVCYLRTRPGNTTCESCSSRSRSTTSARPPICCGRPTSRAAAATGSCRSNARPTSPTTRRRRSPRPPTCGSGSPSRT